MRGRIREVGGCRWSGRRRRGVREGKGEGGSGGRRGEEGGGQVRSRGDGIFCDDRIQSACDLFRARVGSPFSLRVGTIGMRVLKRTR